MTQPLSTVPNPTTPNLHNSIAHIMHQAPVRTPALSSDAFMSAGIREQAYLIEGLVAIEARQRTAAPVNALSSSNPVANIKWKFNKTNFRKLLKKHIACREKLVSLKWTAKECIEKIIQLSAKTQDLKAHIRRLEADIHNLNDECQAYRDALTASENMRRLDASELRHRDHIIRGCLIG
ncbi:hypothetical protein V493_06867 [Pseudogymnoascus sp. VKM F-4281 (FW-2241)]|nr:hypothetical protein V493_06867 [Pseudogymnoascus sp. VKM F-4281 (FW-2241)]